MKRLLPKKKKRPAIDLSKHPALSAISALVPKPLRRFGSRSSLGFRLATGLLTGLILLAILSRNIGTVSASPDSFFLHATAKSGATPAGQQMDITQGSSGATLTFDTVDQQAYWYTDISYPTGSDDASITAGNYTLNLYFSDLPTSGGDWYDPDWQYRKKITIDHTQVAADQTDFPILIGLASDSDLASKAQDSPSAGYDILFTSSNGTTKISHEIEKFDDSTGELVAWVEVPSLSSSTDTELYMYYGNASAGNQQDASGTWSNGYVEVWHLDETSGDVGDSTSNGYSGTVSGSVDQNVTGQVDGADELQGPSTTTYLTLADGDLGNNAPFSISAWFYVDTSTNWSGIVTKGRETGNDWVGLWANGTQYLFGWDWQNGKGGNLDGSTLSLDTWYYGTGTFDGTDRRLYLNDALDAGPSAGNYAGLTGSDSSVGNDRVDANANSFDGTIDEVRISSDVRSASWIQTEYNNQSSPSSFASLAAEEGQSKVDITATVSHTAPDGSGATTIVSIPATIDASTANPLALSLGAGSAQTFTSADPQLIRVDVKVDSLTAGESFTLDYDSGVDPSNLETPNVTVPETSVLFLALVIFVPMLTAAITARRRLAVRLIAGLIAVAVALGLFSQNVSVASAAPDTFYFYNTGTSGISPAGKVMDTAEGSGGSVITFDTPSQSAYWYSDLSYPTGNDNGGIAAGTYTLNMDFSQLPAPQAIAIDTVTSGYTPTTGQSSLTISHTTSGSNRLLLVGVSFNNDNFETVSSVTWNSTENLSLVGQIANVDDARVEIWGLAAPSTGTANVVVTFSTALTQSAAAGVITFTGVDQSTPLGTFANAIGDDSTLATVNVSSAAGELVFGVVDAEYMAVTTDASQDEHWNIDRGGTSSGSTHGAGSTEAGAAPTVTTSWTLPSGSNHWAVGGVSIKPASGSSSFYITVAVHHTRPDGTDAQQIVSTTATIDGNTTNPLALSLGSGSQQTFTSADPRKLRALITVDSVTGGGSFGLAYDGTCASGACSNVDTPVVTVPEWGIAFLLLVPLIRSEEHTSELQS